MGRFVSSGNRAATEVAAQQKAMGNGAQATAFRVGQAFGSMGKDAVAMAGSIGRGVMAAGAAVEKFGNQIRSAGQGISSMGQTLSIGLTAPLSAAGLMALKASGDMEQTQVAFTTLLGSAQAAGDYIKGMKEFAAGTPFEFAGVKQASQQLMAFGFEAQEVEPMLRNIGDALSAMGNVSEEGIGRAVVALGQMKASGTVLKQDLNQLIALNIPVFDILSEKLGMTAAEVAKIGESGIDSSEAINALLEGLDEKFGGSMAAQSQTLLGLWSTLKDNASFIFADIGDAMVKAFDIKGKIMEATEGTAAFLAWFQGLDDSARRTALGIAVFMAALGPVLVVVGALVSALGSVIIAFGAILSPMGLLVAGVVAFGFCIDVIKTEVLMVGVEPCQVQHTNLPSVYILVDD
jgi:tape measure domain-containing protein